MPSTDAQKFVKEFEASEIISESYKENPKERFAVTTDTHSIHGEFADVVRTLLSVSDSTPVTITKTSKTAWEDENEETEETGQDELTLRVEAGEANQVFTGSSYYAVIGELVEWLATA